MTNIHLPQNPGIGGLDELTSAEEAFIQNLAGLSYTQGDILYHDGSDLTNLAKGTATQHLRMNAGATAPEWVTLSMGSGDLLADGTIPLTANWDIGGFDITNIGNLTGGSGQMTITGGTASGDDLLLVSTSNGTKGTIALGSLTTGLIYDGANKRVSIGGDETTTTVNGVSKASTFSTHITGGSQDYNWMSHVHSNSIGPVIAGARTRGSEASPSIVQNGDNLLDLFALGYDGTDFEQAAAIHMDVDGTPGNDDMPGRIVFLTTADGAVTPTERMRIDSAGVITGKAGAMSLARISGSTFSTVQHLQDIFHSAGWVSGGVITDDADGTITVAAGTGLIRANDTATDQVFYMDWAQEAGANVNLADNDINYIYVEYTGGTPAVFARTSESTDFNTKVLLAVIQRDGTTLHINNAQKHVIGDHANSMIRRMQDTNKFARVTGAIIGATGTRAWATTAGDFWEGLTEFSIAAFDSDSGGAGDTFSYWYRKVSDSGWNEVATQSAIHQTQYDNNSGSLATLDNNKYGVHWCYIETDDHAHVVYGQGNYTLSEAEDAMPPSGVPEVLEANGILVGKIIIKKSAAAFTQIESAFGNAFTPSVATDHGALIGLADDDHTQYLLADGSRALAGAWDMGNQIITNIDIDSGAIDGTVIGANSAADGTFATLIASAANIDGALVVTVDSATTNAVTDVANFASTSSGTPAAGIGVGMLFNTETAAGNTEIGGAIRSITTDVDPTNEDFDMVFYTMLSGDTATEAIRLKSTGDLVTKNDILLGTDTGDKSSIILNDSALADESWSGTTVKGTGGATIAVGDVCYLQTSDSRWELVDGILDGTDAGFKLKLGICVLATTDGAATEMLLDGLIASAAFPTLTVGAPVYLDDTAGNLVVAQPSTTNFAIRVVGEAVSATVLHFSPSRDYIVHI